MKYNEQYVGVLICTYIFFDLDISFDHKTVHLQTTHVIQVLSGCI